jgi:hypothetical protein
MADKSAQLVLDALGRAVADPAGLPLFGSKTNPGLFAATGPSKLAAQRCKDENLLRVVRTETRGKTPQEICALTDKGLSYLLSQTSPRQVLEDLVRAVEARQDQLGRIAAAAEEADASFEALKTTAAQVLAALPQSKTPVPNELWEKFHTNGGAARGADSTPHTNDVEGCEPTILALLNEWQASAASEDYPLPKLYRRLVENGPRWSVGQFHDALRRLEERGVIYLHPWTGPLYDMPEPPLALLVGHEIAYYASVRR